MENLNTNLKREKCFCSYLLFTWEICFARCVELQQEGKVGLMLLSWWQFGRLESEKNDGCDPVLPAPGDRSQEGGMELPVDQTAAFDQSLWEKGLDGHALVEEEQQKLKPAYNEDIIQVVTSIGVRDPS